MTAFCRDVMIAVIVRNICMEGGKINSVFRTASEIEGGFQQCLLNASSRIPHVPICSGSSDKAAFTAKAPNVSDANIVLAGSLKFLTVSSRYGVHR